MSEKVNYGFQKNHQNDEELVIWIDNSNGDLIYFSQAYSAPPPPLPEPNVEDFYPITVFVREISPNGNQLPIIARPTNMLATSRKGGKTGSIFLAYVDENGKEISKEKRKRRNTAVKVTSGGGG